MFSLAVILVGNYVKYKPSINPAPHEKYFNPIRLPLCRVSHGPENRKRGADYPGWTPLAGTVCRGGFLAGGRFGLCGRPRSIDQGVLGYRPPEKKGGINAVLLAYHRIGRAVVRQPVARE